MPIFRVFVDGVRDRIVADRMLDCLADAYARIERFDVPVAALTVHPTTTKVINETIPDQYEPNYPYIWGATVTTHPDNSPRHIHVLSDRGVHLTRKLNRFNGDLVGRLELKAYANLAMIRKGSPFPGLLRPGRLQNLIEEALREQTE